MEIEREDKEMDVLLAIYAVVLIAAGYVIAGRIDKRYR